MYNSRWFAENVIGATVAMVGIFVMFIALPVYIAFNLVYSLMSVI